MQQTSSRAYHLRSSLIRKLLKRHADGGYHPALFGEAVSTSQIAVAAANKALETGDHFYQPNSGKPPFRDALCSYMNGLYGTKKTRQNITVTASACRGFSDRAALMDVGDKAVCIEPVWPNLAESFELPGDRLIRQC